MKQLIYFFKIFRALSLEVATGAVVISLFISLMFNVTLQVVHVVPLFLSVWVIYTTDHLIDASREQVKLLTFRHQYHLKNRRVLILSVILVSAFSLCWVLLIFERNILLTGLLLSMFVAIYLLIAQSGRIRKVLPIFKELFTSIGYTVGVLILPVSLNNNIDYQLFILSAVIIFLLALSNLLLFSLYELEIDIQQKQKSSVAYWGKKKVQIIIKVLLLVCSCLIIYLFKYTFNICFFLVLLSMNITLYLLLFKRKYFYKKERYRIWGDGIFLFPIIVLLYHSIIY